MAFFSIVSRMADRILTQADEHVITWSISDHADNVEQYTKDIARLEKLAQRGAELDANAAYARAFAIKATINTEETN